MVCCTVIGWQKSRLKFRHYGVRRFYERNLNRLSLSKRYIISFAFLDRAVRKGKSGNIGKHEWKLTFAPKMHHLVSNALMVFNDDFLVVYIRRVVVDSSSCNHVVYCARASCETYRARACAHRTFPLCFNSTSHTCIVRAWVLDVLFMVRSVCNGAVAIESYLMSIMMRPYLSLKASARYLRAQIIPSLSLALCLLPDFHHDWWQICSRESHFKSVYKIHT